MGPDRHRSGLLLFAVAALAAAALAVFSLRAFARKGVDTDLYSLVGDGGLLAELARGTSEQVRVLCETPYLAARCRACAALDPPVDQEALLEVVRTHGRGLLAEKTRLLLEANETNRLARSILRRDYSGVGLFPKADDPCYFLNDYVLGLKDLQGQELPEGWELLTGRLSPTAVADAQQLGALIGLARAEKGIYLSGAPFHTLLAAEASRREIGALGAASLVLVLALGCCLFRSLRFVLPTALALAFGFLAGIAAVLAMPGRPHVLTLLFGTSLIGLGVDYCYHGFSANFDEDATVLHRRLAGALVTTVLAFSPLLFSSVGVLRQMAVFTIAGLVAIWASVLLLRGGFVSARGPGDGVTMVWMASPGGAAGWIRRVLTVVAVVALAVGLMRVRFENDLSRFHRPDPVMAAGEKALAEFVGGAKEGFALAEGADLEETLEHEEETGAGLVSRFLPSQRRQRRNAALKAAAFGEPKGDFLRLEDLPASVRGLVSLAIVRGADGRTRLLAPTAGPGDFSPARALGEALSRFSRETIRLLAVSGAVLVVVLGVLFRRRFFEYVSPVALAVLSTVGVIGLYGEPINFFQLLCFFVLAGLGIDYTIFHHACEMRSSKVVFYSFLTSLAGLGMLSFTSFQVTSSMGKTFALGLFFSYVYSLPRAAWLRLDERTRSATEAWHEQCEQSAGRLRMQLMWLVYRYLGKGFAKVVTFFVMLFVYPFCGPGRAALRQFAEVLRAYGRKTGVRVRPPSPFGTMLNFAWSMLDKTDACSLKKNLPRLALTGDRGWLEGGCFLLSTHVGCIEVLPAVRQTLGAASHRVKVHAFQQMGHDAVFTRLFTKYLDPKQLTLHAVEAIGVETAVEMKEAIERGEIVLMAGDRPSAGSRAVLKADFLGRSCVWPKGVFRFAKLMGSPVYAIVCVRVGWNAYEVMGRRMEGDLLSGYVRFLEEVALAYPDQWYQFYRFFPQE